MLELLWNGPNPMLAVKGRGRVEVDAPPLEVQGEVEALRLELRVPRTPGDVRWDGELLVSVQDPTSPTGFRYVGGKSLTPLEEGRFSRIEIPVPQHLRNHFVGSPRVRLTFKLPGEGSPYFLDDFGFETAEASKTIEAVRTTLQALTVENVSMPLPRDVSLANTVLFGSEGVDVRNGTIVASGPGVEVVCGQGPTTVQSTANVQTDVRSVGDVILFDQATVDGNIITGGQFIHQNQWTVTGDILEEQNLLPGVPLDFAVEYPTAGPSVQLEPDQAQTLPPGSYGAAVIKSRAKLDLSAGEYFFDSLLVESEGELALDTTGGPVILYVQGSLSYRGKMGSVPASDVLVIATGTSQVEIDAPFRGTLVAPNAALRLSPVDSTGHVGAFFARQVVAEANNPIQHTAYARWDDFLRSDAVPPHASPTAWIRARWTYADGEPLVSFSYRPAGAGSGLQNLQSRAKVLHHAPPVSEPETTQLQFEIENLPVSSGGREVAYSVTMKSWGLGNFYTDHVLREASAVDTLQPGTSTTFDVPDLKSTLGVKATDMPAKGDIVVGLHELTGTSVEAVPFALLRLPQFFYHFSDDLSQVYTYSLERASDLLAPAGMVAKDGVVERYDAGFYHADLFAPAGFLEGETSEDARARLLSLFPDRPGALFGIRWNTHANSASPGPVVPPGASPSELNEPYDPAHGATPLCATWPTTFVDNGPEHFPVRSTNEFAGIVDFLPASFNRAQLFRADGTQIGSDHILDEHGCMPPQELGKGNYFLRVFTDGMLDNGVRMDVRRFEPPEAAGADKALSVTYAIFLEWPGTTNPHGSVGVTVTTGMWTNTTHVAGFASHILARDATGVEMGFTRGSGVAVHPIFVNTAQISHFNGARLNVNAFLSENTWVSDARWKFVLGHEFGHMVQGFGGASLPARYLFNGNTSIPSPPNFSAWTADIMEPDSVTGYEQDCSCNAIEEGPNRSHCLQSVEVSASAQQEGYAHFMAARMWNKASVDDGFSGECSFTYYKQVSASNLVNTPELPPVVVDCGTAYQHRNSVCSAVTISGQEAGTEIDWLTFFQAVTSDPSQPVSVSDLFSWYRNACGGVECTGATFVTYSMLRDGAPGGLHGWLDGLAAAHGVD